MQIVANGSEYKELISGNKIISLCSIKFNIDHKVQDRDKILVELVKNKKIIHVGCVDHMDILDMKITHGTWLHELLMRSAKKCLGIDINESGIKYIQEKYKIPNLVSANLIDDTVVEIENDNWDYLLLPEVVEHIPDIVTFLTTIKKKYMKKVNRIIITVPNMFSYSLFQNARKDIETINTDHRYWFSPFTITKILADSGFEVENLLLINGFWGPFYCNLTQRITNRILKLLKKERKYKQIRDMRYAKGLLVIAR